MSTPAKPTDLHRTERVPEERDAPRQEAPSSRVGPPGPEEDERGSQSYRLADMRRSERAMILVRWGGVVFAVVQVLAYRTEPYPPGVREAAIGVAAFLAVANVGIWLASRRTTDLRRARRLAVAALVLDILVASAFVWLYAFDAISALWAILFILPLEGAIRFGLPGALLTWASVTVLYVGRELYAAARYLDDPFEPESVSFRMGIGLLIALVAGMMARNLTRQRAQLTEALSELWRTDALRSRMIATLAHDVRNPLTTIRGTFKTIARHRDRIDEPTLEELIHTADRQAGRLERLAADLLDLARTERGRLELHVSDLGLREEVDRALGFVDQDRRVDIRVPDDVTVRADPQRLEQVIVNLLVNAFRYGEEPFVVESRPGPDGTVDVLFKDRGPGISHEDRELLFEPFRTESERGSVGLGLAIVKALVEAQGGSVAYEENTPRGACFRIRLLAPAG
jgi:signal transduction histidine kinase